MNEDIAAIETDGSKEDELKMLIESYRDLVGECINRVDELESMLMDGVLNPVRQEMERAELKQRKDAFVSEIGDKLSIFDKKLKVIEQNPDFSLNDVAFDEYEKLDVAEGAEKPTATEFADKMAEKVEAEIASFVEALTASDNPEEIADAAEDAKDAIDAAADAATKEDKSEEAADAAADAEKEATVDAAADSEELTDDDIEELENMRKNVRKALGVYGK